MLKLLLNSNLTNKMLRMLKNQRFKDLKIKKPINSKCKRQKRTLCRKRDKILKIDLKMPLKKLRRRLKPNNWLERRREECKKRIELEVALNYSQEKI